MMNKLMLSCKKAGELTEKKLDSGLSLREEIQLYMHQKMCSTCTLYEKQSKWINDIFMRIYEGHAIPADAPDEKVRIEELKKKIYKEVSES
jgi:hypothetical protein